MSFRTAILSSILILFANLLMPVPHALAGDMALGEMRTYGDVFIRSSTGNWTPAPPSYPILVNTAVNIEKGAVALRFKDGSRINLDESTTAVITGTESGYAVHLSQGGLAIHSSPAASLALSNTAIDISVNNGDGVNQGVAFLGTMRSRDKKIEVQSLSGEARVRVSALETRILPAGKGMVIGSDESHVIHAASKKKGKPKKKCHKPKPPKKRASPYSFDDGDDDFCFDDD